MWQDAHLVKTKQKGNEGMDSSWVRYTHLSLALKDPRCHCSPSRPCVFGNAEDMSRRQQASLRGSQLDSGTHSLIVTLGSISSVLWDLREISVLDLSLPAITVPAARVHPPSKDTVTREWLAYREPLVGGRDLINELYRIFPNV